ncbi:conserved protein of unknown function (plasmid) [Rhodovastum atsumiense]|uniref:Growth inhibitor PemK n=1 Tax=Rhodovastum atsumiense TaxID=504468 RepID=A0A5M6IK12_9PROT|nr:hypothetical protein [Rhodovastum atsumiense]KAA5608603.1 hypothetical protein F1189_28195 [Rhodovastum atsumiense]CAH2605880.1 conserved protein of unknown function [Rhodovastum atsumiense]
MTPSAPPPPGSVIRYAYLWADENAAGREEGRKDRPALVLALAVQVSEGHTQVLVLAITHTPPADPADAVAFPMAEKRRLGLDDLPSWIVTTEGNAFVWPGPDIRPIPGRPPGTIIYGEVSCPLLRQIAQSYLANRERQRTRLVARTS